MWVNESCIWLTDESDDEDERPSRRRRLGERAAEGADEDEDVCLLLIPSGFLLIVVMVKCVRSYEIFPMKVECEVKVILMGVWFYVEVRKNNAELMVLLGLRQVSWVKTE